MMRRRVTLHSALEKGAQKQLEDGVGWTIDVMMVSEAACSMYWDDLTGVLHRLHRVSTESVLGLAS